MRNCSLCGEYKKVMFRANYESLLPAGIRYHGIKFGKYICEDCDKAIEIKESKERVDKMVKDALQKAEWRKERDKLLEERAEYLRSIYHSIISEEGGRVKNENN